MNDRSDLNAAREALEEYVNGRDIDLDEDQISLLIDYCVLIARWNRLTSLVQARSLSELVQSHIIDCLAAINEIRGPAVADVGSGAGLPGVVFAIARPAWTVYLVEANQRRARFLTQVKIELALNNIEICNARIEQWRAPRKLSCITSRAFSSLGTFYQCCRHLLDDANPEEQKGTGAPLLVALKGRVSETELGDLQLPAGAVDVKKLDVPGREYRHAVLINPSSPKVSDTPFERDS